MESFFLELREKLNTQVFAYTLDLSKREQINETAERVKTEVGEIDILVSRFTFILEHLSI